MAASHAVIMDAVYALLQEKSVRDLTMEEIANHVNACRKKGTYKPRVDKLPFYDTPVNTNAPWFGAPPTT